MLADRSLPEGLQLVRTTPEFTASTVPEGLRRAHRIAPGVWGCLRVLGGSVVYVLETTDESRTLETGDAQVIEPDVEHHVVPGPDAAFVVEFYR